MRDLLFGSLIALLASCSSPSVATSEAPTSITIRRGVSHAVFFELRDGGDPLALVADCYSMLGGLPGIVSIDAGTRSEKVEAGVGLADFDVSLIVLFEDAAALEHYATAPDHLAFIEKNKESWASVRVFDSDIQLP